MGHHPQEIVVPQHLNIEDLRDDPEDVVVIENEDEHPIANACGQADVDTQNLTKILRLRIRKLIFCPGDLPHNE